MIPITPVSTLLFLACVVGGAWAFSGSTTGEAMTRFVIILPLFMVFGLYGLVKLGPNYFRDLPANLQKSLKFWIGASNNDRDT